MRVLFYGSCNASHLIERDEFGRRVFDRIEEDHQCVSHMCHDVYLNELALDRDIKTADLIITQPIADDYRGKPNLSTNYLLTERKAGTPVVIFPPIRFDAYYPDYGHLHVNGKMITDPEAMHLGGIYQCWKDKRHPIDFIREYVDNPDLFSSDKFEERARLNISETGEREKKCKSYATTYDDVWPLDLTPFYETDHKRIPLTYTTNHPSKHTMFTVGMMINDIVNSTSIGSEINLLANPEADTFGSDRWIIYSSIQKNVDFATSLHPPRIRDKDGREADINFLCNYYYEAYDKL